MNTLSAETTPVVASSAARLCLLLPRSGHLVVPACERMSDTDPLMLGAPANMFAGHADVKKDGMPMAAQFSVDTPARKLGYLQTLRQYAVQTGFSKALELEGPVGGIAHMDVGAQNDETALRYLVTACGTSEMGELIRDASTAWEAWKLLQMAYGSAIVTDAYAHWMGLKFEVRTGDESIIKFALDFEQAAKAIPTTPPLVRGQETIYYSIGCDLY